MNWREAAKSSYSSDVISEPNGEVYMQRYFLDASKNLRIHHIMMSDPDRDLHDHPWDFVSLILEGVYIEETEDGRFKQYRTGDVLLRTAETLHRLVLPEGPVWTYVVTQPVRRRWGFQTLQYGWVPWRDYYRSTGRPVS